MNKFRSFLNEKLEETIHTITILNLCINYGNSYRDTSEIEKVLFRKELKYKILLYVKNVIS
jgi:hypothetical protein